MKYKTLRLLQYENKDEAKIEYEKRYESEWTTKLDFLINDNRCFFLETKEISELVRNILRTNGEIARIETGLPREAINQFRRKCLIDEIILTNSIEGVHSTRKEIIDIIEDADKNEKNRLFGLVQKYLMLRENNLSLETSKDIREIFDELVAEEIGSEDTKNLPDGELFRKNKTYIQSANMNIIHEGVFSEDKIIFSVDKALNILRDESIELLYRVAIFHYLFEYIHPFYDGNGRVGRFICSYLLTKNVNELLGYRISYTIKENISKYYKAFKTCNDEKNMGDLTPFITDFLEIVEESINQLKKALLNRKVLYFKHYKVIYDKHFEGNRFMFDLYRELLIATLFGDSGLKSKELQQSLDISASTLRKRLNSMDEYLLIVNKRGKENLYSLNIELL